MERADIDDERWNDCIAAHANGLIYAHSLVLDHLAVNWNAVVLGDYSGVMPLPWRKKWGLTYHFKPAFIQQLGIVGGAPADMQALTELIFDKVQYGTLLFNFSNTTPQGAGHVHRLANLVLDLSEGYNAIAARYLPNAKSNIRRSAKRALNYMETTDAREAIDLYKHLYAGRVPSLREADFIQLDLLCAKLQQNGRVLIRKVLGASKELLAIALFLTDGRRLYNLIPCTTAEGRQQSANFFLMDQFIREFAGQPLLLDWEGSDIPGIRRFYEQFGAVDQPYGYLQYNHLPWPLRLFKK